MITCPAFAGRDYAVLGLARSGLATVAALLASGARVTAWDDREEARAAVAGRAEIADLLAADLRGFAGIVVSPGVPLNRHPIARKAAEAGVPLVGDIELFAQARPALPRHKVVGITGTNGKSTTAALVHHILTAAGVPAALAGNIGDPILGRDPLPAGGVYVLELSSYQIDLTRSLDCDVAVLLNITPDHLDRYDGFEAYRDSKLRLFAIQSPTNIAIFSGEDQVSYDAYQDRSFEIHDTTLLACREELKGQEAWPALQGPHNAANAAVAAVACRALGANDDDIERGFRSYPGLPHRMERVAERHGVLFVNDSKATNTDAAAPALAAFDNVHWIVGGLAKTKDLGECAYELDHVRAAYTIGESGRLFARLLHGRVPAVQECGQLDAAVHRAARSAVAGEVVLLSPACASFDQFRDFEARGEAFRAAVEALA